jgi:rhodanese-related sulfurtransferase
LLKSHLELIAAAKAVIKETSIEEARAPNSNAVVLDIREATEFASGHIPGARNVPRGLLEFNIHSVIAETCEDGDLACKPIIVYCASGGRSALAAHCLQSMGFTEVRSLAGGIAAWTAANLALQFPD